MSSFQANKIQLKKFFKKARKKFSIMKTKCENLFTKRQEKNCQIQKNNQCSLTKQTKNSSHFIQEEKILNGFNCKKEKLSALWCHEALLPFQNSRKVKKIISFSEVSLQISRNGQVLILQQHLIKYGCVLPNEIWHIHFEEQRKTFQNNLMTKQKN